MLWFMLMLHTPIGAPGHVRMLFVPIVPAAVALVPTEMFWLMLVLHTPIVMTSFSKVINVVLCMALHGCRLP
jgi:hypothetical protein